MAIGTYTEPHGASPGAPYAPREQLPPADLNQVIDNQRTLWGAVGGKKVIIEEGDLGNGSNRAAKTDSSNAYVTLDYANSSLSTTLIAGDIVRGVAGPFKIANADASHAASFQIMYVEDLGGANTARYSVEVTIPANTTEVHTFPFRHAVITPGSFGIVFQVKSGSAGAVTASASNNYYRHGSYEVLRTA